MAERERIKINLTEFYGSETDPLACPGCGAHRFVVTNTYWVEPEKGKRVKKRLRKCGDCGHTQTEIVPPPIIDGATTTERTAG